MLAANVRWFDDWFAIENVAPGVFAIGEPRYHELNWNYLVCGETRALLFDTGPGLRDIRPVVESLTDLAVTAMASHLHYDHTGNLHRFSEIALADLPLLRPHERDGLFHAPEELFLGSLEDMVWTPIRVTHWWPVGHRIDLGGRILEIIAAPGHSADSVSLYDAQAGLLLAADFLYLGELYAQVPGSSLPDYLATAETLFRRLPPDVLILGAHGQPDLDGRHAAPKLHRPDLENLASALRAIRDRELSPVGRNPARYPVNDRLALLVGPTAYGTWR